MVATVSTQTPIVRSTAESILVMVYKLAMGQFAEVLHSTTRPQNEGSNPSPLGKYTQCPTQAEYPLA